MKSSQIRIAAVGLAALWISGLSPAAAQKRIPLANPYLKCEATEKNPALTDHYKKAKGFGGKALAHLNLAEKYWDEYLSACSNKTLNAYKLQQLTWLEENYWKGIENWKGMGGEGESKSLADRAGEIPLHHTCAESLNGFVREFNERLETAKAAHKEFAVKGCPEER